MKTYRLEKLSIKPGHHSGVSAGSSTTSKNCFYAEFDASKKKVVDIDNPEISDIKVGGYLMVIRSMFLFNKTSEIQDILETAEDSITFETTSSVYKLEITNE